jgi:signal transduction histidine kinase
MPAGRSVGLRVYRKMWSAGVAASTATMIVGALFLPRSFRLTALSDWIQCLLLLSATLCFIPNAVRSGGRLRAFWSLMAAGMALWFFYQLMWTYFEVWLRQDVPDLFAGDIVLFLHIVPLTAALALRPHAVQEENFGRLRQLDFALMMVWWMYLYIFAVMAWQYVVSNIAAYDGDLNLLYLIEKVAFLSGLFAAWCNSKGGWKIFYANLFGASLIYSSSSYLANWAIGRNAYYSGSLYDIPLVVSMSWISLTGLWSREDEPQTSARSSSTSHSVWLAHVGMIAVFSLPLFAAWSLLETVIPPRIRSFRLVLTLGAALFMGVLVFVRQRLLDRELFRLLSQSQDSRANLKRLQAQIMESEKLASMGQLVGGAAHELNNPIAAMLGYSDLLLNTTLNPEQKELASKIGQDVRRTRSLVASLLGFARQRPATMATVDLKTVLQTAVKVSESAAQALNLELRTEIQTDLPAVMGDSNHLLQVCVQVLNHAMNAGNQRGIQILGVAAEHRDGMALIEVREIDRPRGGSRAAEEQEVRPMSGLGLTACQGILREHGGNITWQLSPITGIRICVELPVIPPTPEPPAIDEVPVMWQPQSFA